MFRLDSPRLLGSRPAVLAATLPANKFYILYILPCVWNFFSNPRSDHDKKNSKREDFRQERETKKGWKTSSAPLPKY